MTDGMVCRLLHNAFRSIILYNRQEQLLAKCRSSVGQVSVQKDIEQRLVNDLLKSVDFGFVVWSCYFDVVLAETIHLVTVFLTFPKDGDFLSLVLGIEIRQFLL